MDGLFQRLILFCATVVVALGIYFVVVESSTSRYSVFKLARAEAATPEQLLAAKDDANARFSGPKLHRGDVARLAEMNEEFAKVIEHVQPAVVSIDTTIHEQKPAVRMYREVEITLPNGEKKMVRAPMERPELMDFDFKWDIPGVGSGVFISEAGHIITNHHVVLDVDNIVVTTHDGEVFQAELIGADSTVDIAVLRVKNARDRKFPVLNFADSDQAHPGELVFAFGNPFGLTQSITQGMVNGIGRRFVGDLESAYIQTDAVINPGNSGGPLANIFGEVIGINVIVYSGQQDPSGRQLQAWQGIGLALPSNRAIESYEDIMRLGLRIRPYLGVVFNELTPEGAEAIGLETGKGALINQLEEDSPARGILEAGDVVLRIGAEEIGSVSDAGRVIKDQEPGAPLPIEVWRKGARQLLGVELGEFSDVNQIARLPKELGTLADPKDIREAIGLTLRELTARDRQDTGMPADLGAIFVRSVAPGSPLSRHLLLHDVIHEVNGQAIWSEDQFYQLLSKLPPDESATMMLTRKQRRYYLELRPG